MQAVQKRCPQKKRVAWSACGDLGLASKNPLKKRAATQKSQELENETGFADWGGFKLRLLVRYLRNDNESACWV